MARADNNSGEEARDDNIPDRRDEQDQVRHGIPDRRRDALDQVRRDGDLAPLPSCKEQGSSKQ